MYFCYNNEEALNGNGNGMSDEKKSHKIVIQGVTESGEKFRPSNWAERMSGKLSTFKNHRIRYSPMLRPIMKEGYHCIMLDEKLKESNPTLYKSIMDFAEKHELKICDHENKDE